MQDGADTMRKEPFQNSILIRFSARMRKSEARCLPFDHFNPLSHYVLVQDLIVSTLRLWNPPFVVKNQMYSSFPIKRNQTTKESIINLSISGRIAR